MTQAGEKKLLFLLGDAEPDAAVVTSLREHFEVVFVPEEEREAHLSAAPDAALFAVSADAFPARRLANAKQVEALLNSIGEGVCLCRCDGEIVWSNAKFAAFDRDVQTRVAELSKQACERISTAQLGPDAPPNPTRKFLITAGDDGRTYEVVVTAVMHDVPADAGKRKNFKSVDRVASVVIDVTRAQRMQQKIDAIDRAGAELVRIEADEVRKVNAVERLKILQDKIVRLAHELLSFDHFAIRLLDPDTGRLDLVMSVGLPPAAQEVELYAVREGNGVSGYVAATSRSYICHDVSADDRYVTGLDQAGSSLTVPLLLNDRVVGVFNVESGKVGVFTEDDRQFAEIFARHIALALHILDLLVVERCAVNETLTGAVEGELREPLEDLAAEAVWLRQQAAKDPEIAEHAERILADIEAIRSRTRAVTRGPRSLLGADAPHAQVKLDPVFQGKRVLIADDETEIRMTIRDVLERRGASVALAATGAEAVAVLETSAEGGAAPFDLVISDIRMPDRNGYEVFAAARRASERTRVILMTGFGYDPHHCVVRASQEGLQCVLFKPFQVQRLIDEIRRALTETANSSG